MPVPLPFDVIVFGSFLQVAGQIHNRHIEGGDMKGHASELPVQLRNDLAHSLGSASGSRDDVWGSPSAITPQLPRGAIPGLLGGSDGMDCGRESFHDAEVVMDDLGQGPKQLVVQEALLTVFMELPYLQFTPITNMGHPQKGQR